MDKKEFEIKVRNFAKKVGVEMVDEVKLERGVFTVSLLGVKFCGNPVTGTITANWGDHHTAMVPSVA